MSDSDYSRRLEWFHKARFGMFIHFGLYSLLERGEWVMLNERIPAAQYAKLARRFNPRKFDPGAWAKLAVESGMKYMVLTSRHHDGFCLFDSQVSDFTSVRHGAHRDLVAEYVAAAREAGLRVGLYYSLLDWRFSGYFEPQRYPESYRAMVDQAHAQVRELLTRYGRIDLLWFDGGWNPAKIDIAEFWRGKELLDMMRQLQPDVIINNRAGLEGDLDTPEQFVRHSAPGRGWESCMTIGDSCGWGYIRHNPNLKSVCQLLQYLCESARGEGNYLLNVGPKPDGTIRPEESKRLLAMGQWLQVNGEAIYGSQRCKLPGGMIGAWTRRGNSAYLLIFRYPGREAVVPLVATKAVSARLLGSPAALTLRQEHNGRLVISGLPARPPHPCVNVVRVEFESEPAALPEPDRSAWLEGRA